MPIRLRSLINGSHRRYSYYFLSIFGGALIGTGYTFYKSKKYEGLMPEYIFNSELLESKAMGSRPTPPPVTKHIKFDKPPRENFPYKLTLYQYATCPFCCKVRAYLNYYRIPYDIVEVNSVMRSETKWSIYKKVPILVIENEQIQLNDSSVIISAIESYLRIPTKSFKHISKLYQSIIEKDDKGKLIFNYPNKYFLVEPLVNDRIDPMKQVETENIESIKKKGDRSSFSQQYKLERKWRDWVDTKFVHTLSPNIYCTLKQSLHAFHWFSQIGEWEQIFPWYQRWIIIYVGAIVMRVVAANLKLKYNLKDDVRLSMYECVDEWMKAVGNQNFLGGSEPNLADLNVYGVLTSIEGCEAFQDLMKNTNIRPWFDRMKLLSFSSPINH